MQHIIDVRSPAEFNSGHAEKAINIPLDQLAQQLGHKTHFELDDHITLYCLSGGRAGVAKTLMQRAGFSNVTNAGGISNLL